MMPGHRRGEKGNSIFLALSNMSLLWDLAKESPLSHSAIQPDFPTAAQGVTIIIIEIPPRGSKAFTTCKRW